MFKDRLDQHFPRYFVMAAALAGCLSVPLAARAEEPAPEKASLQKSGPKETGSNVDGENVVIFKEKGVYTPFPSLYVDEDGALITQFSRRPSRDHINIAGQTHGRFKSEDGGSTWKEISKTAPLPGLPPWKTKSGEWVQVRDEGWHYVDASEREKLEVEGYRVRKAGEGKVAYLTPNYIVMRSRDQGATWESETFRAPDYVHSLYHIFPSHTTLLASNGVRIRVLHGHAVGSDKNENFIIRSEDDGKTWDFFRVQPEGPGEIGFNESAIIETADKRLLLMMRPEPEGYLWQSFSDDFGKTWSKPESSGIIGHPPDLLALPDGRLLCTYGYRRRPMGVRASVSEDNGKTWKVGSEVILRADGKHRPADQGYPTTVLLKDGSLFTIYYITLEDNITHIAGTKWKLKQDGGGLPTGAPDIKN